MRVMIICSKYTGGGHISVYEAIRQQLERHSDIEFKYVEGFSLSNKVFIKAAQLYGFFSRKARIFHNFFYVICQYTPFTSLTAGRLMRKKLRFVIDEYEPDMILSLHPGFNQTVINCLERYNKTIPHSIVISDIVTISRMWVDKRSDIIFCPTAESEQACIKMGIDKSHIRCSGLPVRKEFFQNSSKRELNSDSELRMLLISGAEGVGKLDYILLQLLERFNSRVTVITGRNEKLLNNLNDILTDEYKSRVTLLGYIDNMPDVMSQTDIIITRSSPNLMFEAISMNIPFVAFSKPLLQEKGNAELINSNSLGLICDSEKEVADCVHSLTEDNFKLYNFIREKQAEYANPDAAEAVVNEMVKLIKEKNTDIE